MRQRHALLACLSILSAATAAQAQDAVVMRISHQLPPGHHISKLLEQFAGDVERDSRGRLRVQLFGSEQIFKADQNHAAVARGQVEGAISANFQWGNTIPEMNVISVPYLITDLVRINRFPGSEAQKLLDEKLSAKGVRNIAWFYTTRQAIFTSAKRPLIKADDFKGVKIRGINKLVDNGLVAAGASPAAMPGSEVYQALQTGVIDAGLTDVAAAYSRKFFEVQKFGTVSPFFSVYFHLYLNPKWYDGLPADLRAALHTAAAKAERDAIPMTEMTAGDAINQLEVEGMLLHIHTAQEAGDLEQIMQPPVIEAFRKSSPDAGRLIDLISKL